MQSRRVGSLEEIRAELSALDPDQLSVGGVWSVGQVFSHCAQSIEYSLIGFPTQKPAWFQASIGKLVLWRFLVQGYMSHSVDSPIPGAPPPAKSEPRVARDRLLAAIDKFLAHPGPFAPHFAYGLVDKERYGQVQAMHIAEHLETFRKVSQPVPVAPVVAMPRRA